MNAEIPNAAIEAATAAIHPGGIPRANSRAIARAAIEAAMPAIREAIAQDVEGAAYTIVSGGPTKATLATRRRAAAIVRGQA